MPSFHHSHTHLNSLTHLPAYAIHILHINYVNTLEEAERSSACHYIESQSVKDLASTKKTHYTQCTHPFGKLSSIRYTTSFRWRLLCYIACIVLKQIEYRHGTLHRAPAPAVIQFICIYGEDKTT